jgi:hypothetical protein
MKTLLKRVAVGLLAALACAPWAMAQNKPVQAPGPVVPMQAAAYTDAEGNGVKVDETHGLPVWCILGCGGGSGGGGDASAANQLILNNRIGDLVASPAQYSLADRLKTINTTLGTPFQAGGSIGNTSFGISGTLPAFASTPTVNLGTISGAATSALQSTGNASLGSIDTKLSSQATAANQTTGNSSLASILAKQKGPLTFTLVAGSPFNLTSSWTKVATTTAATKGLIVAPSANASAFDIEWTSVTAGAAAPTDLYGVPVGYGETFADGLPIGDVYLKSATGMVATVRTGS